MLQNIVNGVNVGSPSYSMHLFRGWYGA